MAGCDQGRGACWSFQVHVCLSLMAEDGCSTNVPCTLTAGLAGASDRTNTERPRLRRPTARGVTLLQTGSSPAPPASRNTGTNSSSDSGNGSGSNSNSSSDGGSTGRSYGGGSRSRHPGGGDSHNIPAILVGARASSSITSPVLPASSAAVCAHADCAPLQPLASLVEPSAWQAALGSWCSGAVYTPSLAGTVLGVCVLCAADAFVVVRLRQRTLGQGLPRHAPAGAAALPRHACRCTQRCPKCAGALHPASMWVSAPVRTRRRSSSVDDMCGMDCCLQ